MSLICNSFRFLIIILSPFLKFIYLKIFWNFNIMLFIFHFTVKPLYVYRFLLYEHRIRMQYPRNSSPSCWPSINTYQKLIFNVFFYIFLIIHIKMLVSFSRYSVLSNYWKYAINFLCCASMCGWKSCIYEVFTFYTF